MHQKLRLSSLNNPEASINSVFFSHSPSSCIYSSFNSHLSVVSIQAFFLERYDSNGVKKTKQKEEESREKWKKKLLMREIFLCLFVKKKISSKCLKKREPMSKKGHQTVRVCWNRFTKNRNKEAWKWVRWKLVSLLVDINLSRSLLRNSAEG